MEAPATPGVHRATNVYRFPALDVGVPLLSFLFLAALGVDYTIVLVTRAREEAVHLGTPCWFGQCWSRAGIPRRRTLLVAFAALVGDQRGSSLHQSRSVEADVHTGIGTIRDGSS